MITQFKDYTTNQSPQALEEFDHVIIENKGIYPKRMMVFENYWSDSFFSSHSNQSCKPFLENIGQLIGEQVTVGHKYINSKSDLLYCLGDSGVIWDHPETFSVCYFGLHGSKKGFQLTQGLISKKEILKMCKRFGDFPNILYFGSCSLFEDDDQFGYDLLSTGTRGVLGFKKNVPFAYGCLIDLCFLCTLFLFKDGDPFKNLKGIYDAVIEEMLPAKELGFTLYC